jgi:hypothetical protein
MPARLLLTGTLLQNNLTALWALLQFLMSGTNFANLKEFGEWFSSWFLIVLISYFSPFRPDGESHQNGKHS